MSSNVLSIIDVVFGKFKRKFHNKIRPFEPYMHEPTISNKNNICLRQSNEICSDDNSDEELNTRIGNTNWRYMW